MKILVVEDDLPLLLPGQPLQHRPQGPAGPARGRPEVDDHGPLERLPEHLVFPSLSVRVQ